MSPGPRIPKNPGKPAVKVPMGQRKSGLAVPADKVDLCKHMDVVSRIKPTFNQYHCGDCQEKVFLVPIQMKLLTQEEFDRLQMAQVMADRAAQRKKTGLVLPDEARQEQQEKERRS